MNPDARVDGRAGDTSHKGLDFHPAQLVSWVFFGPPLVLPRTCPNFSQNKAFLGLFWGAGDWSPPVLGNFQEGVFLEECMFLQWVEERLVRAFG